MTLSIVAESSVTFAVGYKIENLRQIQAMFAHYGSQWLAFVTQHG